MTHKYELEAYESVFHALAEDKRYKESQELIKFLPKYYGVKE